jgi:hypothetical protein
LLALPAAALVAPLSAQSNALILFAHGGRYSPLVSLSDAGDDFAPAFSYGGGLALQVSDRAAIRLGGARHRSRYRGETALLADSSVTRYVFTADVQIGWPTTSALVPYVFFGGGALTTQFDDADVSTETAAMGRFGVGLNRVSGLGAWFLEFGTMLYQFKGLGFEGFQFDLEARLGFALALGL